MTIQNNKLNRFSCFAVIGIAYQASAPADMASRDNAAVHTKLLSSVIENTRSIATVFLTFAMVLFNVPIASAADALDVVEIADGVFAHQGIHGQMTAENRGHIANIGFIVGADAVAVIDTGGSLEQGRALFAAVRQRTALPIRYVINTHMHPDHVFGNAAFLGPDVAFVGHARLPAALTARFDHYVAANAAVMGADLLAGTRLVLPTITVDSAMTLDLGGRRLSLRAWPVAHTDNDLTVLDETSGTLFTGDLVFMEHLPSIDGSLRGWQRVLDDLAALPARRVVPGHGPLDAGWPAAIAPERRYFEVLARDVRAAIDAGDSLSQAVPTLAASEREHWLLFDDFNPRNATAAFAELEWE